jgi:arsenite/tail-anchored protein-transporting ATPase
MHLLEKKLTFVTGKGGVGKSTVAAALGQYGASLGKKMLVCELGTDGHLARVFGTPLTHAPKRVTDGVDAANFAVSEGLVATLTSFIPFERLVRAVVNNRILQLFIETAPAVTEAVLLDAVDMNRKAYDHVVVELPASGHAITMMQVPEMIRKLVKGGPMAKKATELERAILSSDVADLVLVSLPEALPVQETIELAEALGAASKVPLRAVLLNQTMSPLVQGNEQKLLEKLSGDPALASLEGQMRQMLDASKRDDRALETLRQKLSVPILALPRVMAAESPSDIVGPLARALASF